MDATAYELISRLRRDPQDVEAFQALRLHYQQLADYGSMVNLLEGWAVRSRHDENAASAFTEAGDVLARQLNDPARATALYTRALERSPLHQGAFSHLQKILHELGRYEELADLLQQHAEGLEAAHADRRQVARLHHQLGELWQNSLQRQDRAALHYRRAFELDPQLLPAIYAAREIYRKASNFRAAARLYELEAGVESDVQRKVNLLRELGQMLADRLEDLPGAITALEQAHRLAPLDAATQHDLATALVQRSAGLGEAETKAADQSRATELFLALAQRAAHDEALQPHAAAYCQAALDASPDHAPALRLLEELLAEAGQRDTLATYWRRFLATAPTSPGHTQVRRQLGRFYAEGGRFEDAQKTLQPLLERGDAQAAGILVTVYRQLHRSQDLAQALQIVAREAPPAGRPAVLRELLHVLHGLGHHEVAEVRARELLTLAPQDVEALAFLQEHYRSNGDFKALRDLLLASTRSGEVALETRKQRLREAAALSESKLGEPSEAIAIWRMLTSLEPDDADAWMQLARLFEGAQRWEEWVGALQRQAQLTAEPEGRILLWRRIAALQRQRLDDRRAAAETLRRIYELNPQDRQARDALCDAYLEANDGVAAMPLLQRQLADEQQPTQRFRLLRSIAHTAETLLHDEQAALQAGERWLAERPDDMAALELLERLQTNRGDYLRLLEILQRRLPLAAASERPTIALRMARLCRHEVGQPDQAVELYWQAWQLAPDAVGLLDELCTLYEELGRSAELAPKLAELAHAATDTSIQARIWRRVARLQGKLGQTAEAAAAWSQVLAAGEDEEALRALLQSAAQQGQSKQIVALCGRLAAQTELVTEKRDLMLRQATLLLDPLGDEAAAIAVLEKLTDEVDVGCLPALERLSDWYERHDEIDKLLAVLGKRLQYTEDAGLRVPVARRLHHLASQHQQPDLVMRALQAWLQADPTDSLPLQELCTLLEQQARWPELLVALDQLGEREASLRPQLARRSAAILEKECRDPLAALAVLEGALQTDLRDPLAADELLRLCRLRGQDQPLKRLVAQLLLAVNEEPHDDALLQQVEKLAPYAEAAEALLDVYEQRRRQAKTVAEACRLLLRIADLHDGPLDDRDQAILAMAQAIDLAIGDDALMQDAEQQALRMDGDGDALPLPSAWQTLLDVYQRRLQRRQDEPAVQDLLAQRLAVCRQDKQRRTRPIAISAADVEAWPIDSADIEGPQVVDDESFHADAIEDATTVIDEGRLSEPLPPRRVPPEAVRAVSMPRRQPPTAEDLDMTVAEEELENLPQSGHKLSSNQR